jgi:arylsulfatase A-like enzyme
VVGALLERLERVGDGPLFAYVHLMEPHAPYDRGRSDGTAYERYLSEIAVADIRIGKVLAALRERCGDRWVLIVSADHGEAFGEHGSTEHGKTLYEELLHVPLVVVGPRIAPRTVDERVGLVDLGPTILDLFGIASPAAFEGQSLAPLLAGRPASLTRPLLSEARLARAVTLPDGLKVIDDPRRKLVEVYDLSADPGETTNIFDLEPARADPPLALLRAFFAARTLRRGGYEPPYKL